jgi:hypothetical protein
VNQPGAHPGPDCPMSCFPPCGNGIVEPQFGETCDPPDPTPDPNHCDNSNPPACQPKCRPDCTRCGDTVIQASDGETCDDGNTVGGCQPRPRTNRDLDPCQNNCTPPLCGDPSKILELEGLDRFDVHGRIRPVAPDTTVNPIGKQFVVELRTPTDVVLFRSSLLADAEWRAVGQGFKYRNNDALRTGGMAKVSLKPVRGQYRVVLRTLGDLSAAQADMETHVHIGDDDWTIAGEWSPTSHGWRLTQLNSTGN